MDGRVEIKEEPSWDDSADDDGEDTDLQPPLEVYLKTEFCDEQESQQQPGANVHDGANSRRPDRSSSSEDGEFDDVDICQIQPDVLIHTPDEDPLEFPSAPPDPTDSGDPAPDPEPAQVDGDEQGEPTPSLEEKTPDGDSQDLAYSCSGCPLSYSTMDYLKTHKKYCRMLKVPKRKKRPRVHPAVAAAVESNLIGGSCTLKKLPRFKCEICGRRTSTNSNFKQHMLLHSGAKPHKCPQCDAGFARKADMNRHVLGHRGEKPYACQTCGLRFIQSAHLTRHLRVHTGDRPYACDICGEAFANKSNLTPHKRYHHNDKPHRCELCGKKFAEIKQLVTHTSKVHEKKGVIKNELSIGLASLCN